MLTHSDSMSTTVNIPVDLINRAQRFLEMGFFSSQNSLIVAALEQFLAELEEQEMEFDFDEMEEDFESQEFVEEDEEDFEEGGWDAYED